MQNKKQQQYETKSHPSMAYTHMYVYGGKSESTIEMSSVSVCMWLEHAGTKKKRMNDKNEKTTTMAKTANNANYKMIEMTQTPKLAGRVSSSAQVSQVSKAKQSQTEEICVAMREKKKKNEKKITTKTPHGCFFLALHADRIYIYSI